MYIDASSPNEKKSVLFSLPNQGDVLDAWPRLVNVSLMLSWNELPRRHGVPRRVWPKRNEVVESWKLKPVEWNGIWKMGGFQWFSKNIYIYIWHRFRTCFYETFYLIPFGCFWYFFFHLFVPWSWRSFSEIWFNLGGFWFSVLTELEMQPWSRNQLDPMIRWSERSCEPTPQVCCGEKSWQTTPAWHLSSTICHRRKTSETA